MFADQDRHRRRWLDGAMLPSLYRHQGHNAASWSAADPIHVEGISRQQNARPTASLLSRLKTTEVRPLVLGKHLKEVNLQAPFCGKTLLTTIGPKFDQ